MIEGIVENVKSDDKFICSLLKKAIVKIFEEENKIQLGTKLINFSIEDGKYKISYDSNIILLKINII